jgi:glycosyltransferase involved in cell wall biosynthesis
MRISIVTLSFNQRSYLQEAMESILQQGYPDLEYIVVDPGSTDGSRELIKSYGDRIAHAIFEPDRGPADGLNRGFSLATGEILGFLNSDDVLMPGSLQRIADFFRLHPNCGLVFGNGHILDGSGRRVKHVKARDFTVRRYLHGGARWLQQSTFFRHEAFLRTSGFNPENRTCWDGELFVNLANQGTPIGFIDADLSGFRIHAASISGSGGSQQVYRADCRRIFRDIEGRDWRVADDLLRLLYRADGLLHRAAWWLRRLLKRAIA